MMQLIRRIKQKLCRHIDDSNNRNYKVPFVGYEFRCSKCGGYVAYFMTHDVYFLLSELQHNIIVEEGIKLWEMNWNQYKNEGEINGH